ncbi:MAG: arsenic resistance protein [Coriobacteriia bacterium]|nr:arsenic resistance protein [Coriobacteriia bacterium]
MPARSTISITHALSSVSKNLALFIPASMLLGLIAGVMTDLSWARVLILPMTMLMVYPMLVNFRPAQALSLDDAKAVGLAMALDFVALPLIAWGLALVFFRNQPGLFVGMVLAGLFPTSGMTISWTGFAKGNVAAAVKMTIIGLIAASLLAPAYLALFAGTVVPVDLLGVLQTVLLVVGIPMVAGAITRNVLISRFGSETYRIRISPILPGISTIGVLAIVFVAIGLKAQMIIANPRLLVGIAIPLMIFYAVNFALSTVLGKLMLPRGDAVAVVYGTVMRNLSIALGIAVAQFGPEAALVLALAYIIQVQAAAWYVKGTGRIFGEVTPVEEHDLELAAA